ncbi:hypothetical protein FJR48_00830 [Sulfurimonas lithotrophica]|uniref:Uncharacterized protein n=1 Tax=Sulfurimonas lithotrophica TaxID=2590022 RepID=A0A5P8NY30_9BACT|nr:hypothetical protein [Sulfurimonas lithotrophica]QFR48345.1 hypothetical protein FJR48_00830 [Sulfurimonas lithotrophica]
MFEDTYFFNSQEALRVARLQNKPSRYVLQICYYHGDKIDHEGLENLVHLPVDNIVNDLALGVYRIPTKVDFTGLDISQDVQNDILQSLKESITQATAIRNELNKHYFESLQNAKLNFNENLRFYLIASSNTQVMQHISANIARTLEKLGYEVLFNLDVGVKDMNCLKELKEFNPHVTININHLNNRMLSDDVFNFVWIQDLFAIEQFKHTKVRERDFIFHLVKSLKDHLSKLSISSKYQGFCIDTNLYKEDDSIERQNKVVMIGSSYKQVFEEVKHEKKEEIAKDLMDFYTSSEIITYDTNNKYYEFLMEKYDIKQSQVLGQINNYVLRDGFLEYITNINLDCNIELYGWGWENHPRLNQFFKGVLTYGEEISKIYNSAKYSLVLGGYILQQRTLESAASGCIPLVFDSRYNNAGDEDEKCFEDSLLFFKRPYDLKILLSQEHNKDLDCIVNENSFEQFVDKMISLVNKHI